jgi:predicted MFS family arabinose efflux permease
MSKVSPERAKTSQNALLVMFFFQGVISTTQIPRVPELINQVGVGFDVWGLIMGFAAIGSIIGLSAANRLIERFGAQRIARVMAILLAALLVSFAFTTNPLIFFATNIIWTLSMSCFNIAINSQSVILQNALKRVIIGRFHGTWAIGAMLSAAFAGYLTTVVSIQLHFAMIAVLCLVSFLLGSRFMLSQAESHHAERTKKAAYVPLLKTPGKVWLLAFGFFVAVSPELALIDWSAVFGRDALGIKDPGLASVPYTVFMVFMILGRLSIGRMTKRWHISQIAAIGGVLAAIGLTLLVVFADAIAALDSVTTVVAASACLGLAGIGSATLVPSFFSASGHVHGLDTATVMARMSLAQTILIIGTKIFLGSLTESLGIRMAFIVPCVLVLVCAFIAGLLAREARKNDIVADAFPITTPIVLVSE